MNYNKYIIKLINNIQIDKLLLYNTENLVTIKPFVSNIAYLVDLNIIVNDSNFVNLQYTLYCLSNKFRFYLALITIPSINTSQHSVFRFLYNLSFFLYY